MEVKIRAMKNNDWDGVVDIYVQGIKTKRATFQTEAPSFEEWDKGHIKDCRLVAVNSDDEVLGWVALSPTSSRCVYRGVADVSIYIAENSRGNSIGSTLMNAVIEESEKIGIWTLQSGIFEINEASRELHKKCGFRSVGVREKIGCDIDGVWQNTVLMERRSEKMITKPELAAELFKNGFNCSQSVFAVFCEQYGMEKDQALKVACGLGSGLRSGEVCGAVAGAVLAIGLKYGNCTTDDMEGKSVCNNKISEFTNAFRAKHNSIVCRDLLGCDISTQTGLEQAQKQSLFKTTCVLMVKEAVTLLEELGY
jgi:phosphinothricin acetyltransferase